MIWFLVYVTYFLFGILIALAIIPASQRRVYQQTSPDTAGRWLAALLLVTPIVGLVQLRISPDTLSTGWHLLGSLLHISGSSLTAWARQVNPYFVPEVIAPAEVIKRGPYRFHRHPGYGGLAAQMTGAVLIIGQLWMTIPALIYVSILFYRIRQENRLLYAA